MQPEIDLRSEFERIMLSDLPELEKVSKAYRHLIGQYIEISRREIELLKAIQDREALVKEQIKMNVMEYTLSIFNDCYFRATGRKA